MTVGVLILAAGRSSRMGSNKLLRDLGGKPMLTHLLDAVRASGLPARGVTGADAEAVALLFERSAIPYVHHAGFADGMASTIRAGLEAVPAEWDAAIIALGDMPLIPVSLFKAVAERAAPDAIVAPVHQGRRGNPVLWGRDYFPELHTLQGDAGARALIDLHRDRLTLLDWPDDGIFADADTPEAFAKLASRFG